MRGPCGITNRDMFCLNSWLLLLSHKHCRLVRHVSVFLINKFSAVTNGIYHWVLCPYCFYQFWVNILVKSFHLFIYICLKTNKKGVHVSVLYLDMSQALCHYGDHLICFSPLKLLCLIVHEGFALWGRISGLRGHWDPVHRPHALNWPVFRLLPLLWKLWGPHVPRADQ